MSRVSVKRRSVDVEKGERYVPHPRTNRCENAKLQNVVAGAVVVLVVETPADVAKSVHYRPLGHCHQTMSHYVLTQESIYHCDCAG